MNQKRRKICAVTGSRADYGPLSAVLKELELRPELELSIIATGTHLSPQHGQTVDEIEADGLSVSARVPVLPGDDGRLAVTAAVGEGTTQLAIALEQIAPDIVILLGDRFEIFAAAQAAFLLGIPIAHIHGGEITEGAMDDGLRHAISKLSSLHFAATESAARRLRQMGEPPDRVIIVGAIGLENSNATDLADRAELEATLGIPLNDPLLVVTYHPETNRRRGSDEQTITALLSALEGISYGSLVFTGVNSDPGRESIETPIRKFAERHPGSTTVVNSLGHRRYFGALRLAAAVIGNSSSGIIEAPTFNVPTVNIGDRQKGRDQAQSIINCDENEEAIRAAIERAIEPGFPSSLSGQQLAYASQGGSATITNVLATQPLDHMTVKEFHNFPIPA